MRRPTLTRRRILIYSLLGLGLVGLAILSWWSAQPSPTTLHPLPATKQAYPAVSVGKTTTSQLRQILDDRTTEYTANGYTVLTAPSLASPYQPDRFYLANNVVQLKEQWFEPGVVNYTYVSFLQKYGKPEETYYDQSLLGMMVQVQAYPSQGLAVYVMQESGLVRKIQFFTPVTTKQFLAKWGKTLAKTPPAGMTEIKPE